MGGYKVKNIEYSCIKEGQDNTNDNNSNPPKITKVTNKNLKVTY